jgi:hypothetical protein
MERGGLGQSTDDRRKGTHFYYCLNPVPRRRLGVFHLPSYVTTMSSGLVSLAQRLS